MSSRILPWMVGIVLLSACSGPEGPRVDGQNEELGSADEPEFRETFADAALYCDAYLLAPVRNASVNNQNPFRAVPPLCGQGATGCTDDALLKGFAANPPAALTHNSPHGAGAPLVRQLNSAQLVAQERASNGCADATEAFGVGPVNATVSPAPGACRADFNYCLAQQLRLKADSLARPPSSRAMREAILHEARARFALAAGEHTRTLAWVDDTRDVPCQELADVWQWDGQRRTPAKTHFFSTQVPYSACDLNGCRCPGTAGGWDCRFCQLWKKNCEKSGAELATSACNALDVQNKTALSNFVVNPSASHGTSGCGADTSYVRGIPESASSSIQFGPTTASGGIFSKDVTCSFQESHADGYVRMCTGNVDVRERQRVAAGYGLLALERINDALAQLAACTEDEVHDLLGDSEALPLYDLARTGSYGDALWGVDSPRMAAAHVLRGTRSPEDSDLRFADAPVPDDAARIALRLILDLRAPLPYQATVLRNEAGQPTGLTNVSWPRPSDAQLSAAASTAYQALASQLAAQAHLPESEGATILSEDHRVDVAAVKAALRLLDDQLRTLDMDFVFTFPGVVAEGATTVQPAVELRKSAALQRSAVPLAAALVPHNDETQPGLRASYFEAVGAAGTAHFLRKELDQLAQRTGLLAWASEPRLASALGLTDKLSGERWLSTTFNRINGVQTVRLFVAQPSGTRRYLYSTDSEVVSCLRFGHRPGDASPGCLDALQMLPAPVAGTERGRRYEEFSFTLPASPGTPRYFLVEQLCDGTACRYDLIDSFQPGRSQEHPLGGRVMELLGTVLAKSPGDPAYPQLNSLGINTRFVPAFRTLDSMNSNTNEFHMRRLVRAESAVDDAVAEVQHARGLEEAYITTHTQNVQNEERAREGARVAMENACSGDAEPGMGRCEVRRRAQITLAQLGLVQVPALIPTTHDGASCADYALALTLPSSGDDDTLRNVMGDALRCMHWKVKQTAADTIVRDVPEAVVSALSTPVARGQAGPTFNEYGGELQAELLTFYQALLDVRHGFEDFEQGFAIAGDALQTTVDDIEHLEPTEWKKWQCRIGYGLKALDSVAKAVIAAQTGGTLPSVSTTEGGQTVADVGHVETGNLIFDAVSTAASIERCDDPNDHEQLDRARQAYFQVARALDTMQTAGRAAERMVTIVALADNRLDAIARGVRQAMERIDLEDRIAQLDPVLASPIWRRMRGASATRARLDTLRSQQRLFEARRAIEYRTASDLARITTKVDNSLPVNWSGDLFALPTFEPERALTSHAEALRGFVEGYADAYNFSEVHELAESLSLAAILSNELDESVAQSLPFAERLWFKCVNHEELLLGGHLADAPGQPCASFGGVDYATLSFIIPPGLGAYLRSMLPSDRMNVVFDRVVLNFRGTQLRNCEKAVNRNACYQSVSIPYTLFQHAETMLENLDHELHSFDLRPGFMLDVPGLANELSLTDVPAQQIIAQNPNLRRSELAGRPLVGQYALTIRGRPELLWQNLEDLELQISYTAWAAPGSPRKRPEE